MRTCVRVAIKSSPYGNFQRALRTGNLTVIRSAAAELPAINLDDALSICLLVAKQEPRHFERAALRWIGRYCLERRDLTIDDVRDVAEAFARLCDDGEGAAAALRRLSR